MKVKKIFQTIIDKDHGNCEQAVVASLLELSLEDVPNFIDHHKSPDRTFDQTVIGFLRRKGYAATPIHKYRHNNTERLKEIARYDGGINGYFHASVPSQTFTDVSHAVIVDMDLNIIHDPNPNQLALNLKPEDVESIIVVTDFIIGKTGKLFRQNEWDALTEEERDANTYKPIYDENHNVIGSE